MSADSQMSASEMVESLTGFDEIAIEKHMGIDPYADGESKPILVMRALLFVQKRREGLDDAKAKQEVMEMGMKAVSDAFADEADEPMPDEPVTEQGKDVIAVE